METKLVAFKTKDSEQYKVHHNVAKQMKMLSFMFDEEENEGGRSPEKSSIDIDVSSWTFKQVIAFCEQHVKDPLKKIPSPLPTNDMSQLVQAWYVSFLHKLGEEDVKKLATAANYLDIGPLEELCTAYIASWVVGRSCEELNKRFAVTVEMRAEAAAEVRRKYEWARYL